MRRRLLFLIPSLNYGGAEILVTEQVAWLYKNGWNVYVALLSERNEVALIKALGIPDAHLLLINSPTITLNHSSIFFALKERSLLKAFMEKHAIQTIVAHLPLAHLWGRLVKLKMPTVRLVIYHHSMQYQANPSNTWGKKAFNILQKVLANKTDNATICISEAVRKNIESHFTVTNPVILFNAVPDRVNSITTMNCNPVYAEHRKSHISLMVPGRLHPAKGHLFFLNVYRKLLENSIKPLQLTVAGGGALEDAIKQFIALNKLGDAVVVTGVIPNERVLEIMFQSDLVVIPSLSEGLGIVAIEALMLSKTILSSDAGGLKEIITDNTNGYLFKAGDETNCYNKLKYLIDTFPNALIDAAFLRRDYNDRFGFEAHMKKLLVIL